MIPSRITDNRILLESDPGYINRLYLVGSDALVKAWLDGDWSAIEGAFFDCWDSNRHIIRPLVSAGSSVPLSLGDWGSAKPFSIGWWAVASDDLRAIVANTDKPITLPRGCMIRYREWYGAKAPNVGLKLTAEEVAEGILKRQADDPDPKKIQGVLDPSTFAEDGGPSIAERMATQGCSFLAADNKRVAQAGAMGGWDQMRARLKGDADGRPMIVCFSTCTGQHPDDPGAAA